MSTDPVRELLDRELIKETKARYFRTMDSKQWSEMRKVFTDDARIVSSKTWEDPDTFIADLQVSLGNVRSVHHGHMPEIAFTGPDSARVIWAMFDYLEWEPGTWRVTSTADESRGLHGYGHYEEEYRRTADGWRISFLRLTRLRVDDLLDAVGTGEVPRRHSPDWLTGTS